LLEEAHQLPLHRAAHFVRSGCRSELAGEQLLARGFRFETNGEQLKGLYRNELLPSA
jgi:hypothetical protein